MKKRCSNESYHGFHDLEDLLEDIEAKVKAYDIQRKVMFRRVQEEIESNPGQEIFKIYEQFDQAALPEVKLEMSDKLPETTVCRYHYKGFCKHGSACIFYTKYLTALSTFPMGSVLTLFCKRRHREDCR